MPNITSTQGSAIRGRRRSRASRSGLAARAGRDSGNGVAESELDTSAFLRIDKRWIRADQTGVRRSRWSGEVWSGLPQDTGGVVRSGRQCNATGGDSPGRDRPTVSRCTMSEEHPNHGRSSCPSAGRGRVTVSAGDAECPSGAGLSSPSHRCCHRPVSPLGLAGPLPTLIVLLHRKGPS